MQIVRASRPGLVQTTAVDGVSRVVQVRVEAARANRPADPAIVCSIG